MRIFGELGAGKTEFVRGLVSALDGTIPVTSPTFAIVQRYNSRPPIYHADLYRVRDELEYEELDLEQEAMDGILAVEWPEHAGSFLNHATCDIILERSTSNDQSRLMRIECSHAEIEHAAAAAL